MRQIAVAGGRNSGDSERQARARRLARRLPLPISRLHDPR